MPLLTPSGKLSVVAEQNLGDLGPSETEPVYVKWRWYYHLTSVPIWLLVVILLIVVKENRSWAAWLIMVPALLANLLILPCIVRLVPGTFTFGLAWNNEIEFAANSLVAPGPPCGSSVRGLLVFAARWPSSWPWRFFWRLACYCTPAFLGWAGSQIYAWRCFGTTLVLSLFS